MNISPYRSPVSDIVLSSSNTISKRNDLTPDFILFGDKQQTFCDIQSFYEQKSFIKKFFKQKYIKLFLKDLKNVDWNTDCYSLTSITIKNCKSFLFSSFEIKKRFAILEALKMFAISGWVVAIYMQGKTFYAPFILHENSFYDFKDSVVENNYNPWFLMHKGVFETNGFPVTIYVRFYLPNKIKQEKANIQYFLKFQDEYTFNSFLNKSGLVL